MTPLPVHLLANENAAWIYVAVSVVFFVAGLVWCGIESRRRGHALAWLALLGGGIASLEEAWIDHLIQLWYPLNSPLIAFTAMGTPQPLYLHLIYPGFIGLGAYTIYLGLKRYPDGRLLWPTFWAIVVMDFAFEASATWFGIFYYYGEQPFQMFDNGWPAWVAPINAAGPLLAGWLMIRLEPFLQGYRRPLFALLPPIAYTAVYGAAGWPTATLMNSGVGSVWVWAAACVTIALCLLFVHLLRLTLLPSAVAAHVSDAADALPKIVGKDEPSVRPAS